jgi:hypothetical protein
VRGSLEPRSLRPAWEHSKILIFKKQNKKTIMNWGYDSVAEYLPSMLEAQGSVPSTTK